MKHLCPACGCGDSELLEVIDIETQHSLYSGDNELVARKLTHVLSEITSYYELHKCMRCGLEYANPFLAPSPSWYSILYSELNLFPSDRWEFGFVKNLIRKDDFVIDYGCGSGQFLLSITDKTKNIHGFDFSKQAVDEARNLGIAADVLNINLDLEVTKPFHGVDHIVAFHVLEHLESPHALFEFSRELSTDKTHLWVAVPSDMRAARVYGPPDHLDQPPHHLTRWNKESLGQIGLKAGWEMVDFYYEPIGIRARLWEMTRRTELYKKMALKNAKIERLIRVILAVPIYFLMREQLNKLSGFSMLACYKRTLEK